ncbi:ubiquitin-conjugating enzyme [Emydomyces testavorans]|uniref:Ubiquitin-conjugating enzyme n=1 Tax=Emydomyces testavorans TaxID=2070801 RepID=A0AAF0DHW7_9EURO|nr:ubiquitin-conjugating enzyme [Emydomyces testavorans]
MFSSKRLGKLRYRHSLATRKEEIHSTFRSHCQLSPNSNATPQMQESLPPGVSIVNADNFQEWQMDIRVLDSNPLYQNETYRLKFTFSPDYPIGTPPTFSRPPLPPSPAQNQSRSAYQFCFLLDSPEAPEVIFISLPPSSPTPRSIPIHPHIYSNGIICLDLLGSAGWSPVQTVESVCMSIQSMLTGNTKNERPPDDAMFPAGSVPRPRDLTFRYHDNDV